MGCKRFEDELKDAALGGLPPERETELRAHLRECAACRGEFERQQQLVAAMDRSLEQFATAEPSLEMVARIRLKIAEQPEPRRGWLPAWWPAAAGALAAAAFVVYLMIPGETVHPPVESPPVVATTAEPKPAEPVTKAAPPVAVKQPRKPVRPAPVEVADSRPALPEVLVPRDQERALAWLYRTMQRQPQRMNAVLAQEAQNLEEKGKPIQIARLSISPLEIGELESASPDAEIRQ
jgi:hypothetical protein